MDKNSNEPKHENVLAYLHHALNENRELKGRAKTSDAARFHAVAATEIEKVIAYYHHYIALPDTPVVSGKE